MGRETRSGGVKGLTLVKEPTQPWSPLVLRSEGQENQNRESTSTLFPLLSKGIQGLLPSLGLSFILEDGNYDISLIALLGWFSARKGCGGRIKTEITTLCLRRLPPHSPEHTGMERRERKPSRRGEAVDALFSTSDWFSQENQWSVITG